MTDFLTILNRFEDQPDLAAKVNDARNYVEAFCVAYGVQLKEIQISIEVEHKREPLYIFNDNLGGYTQEGLIKSLQERNVQLGF